MTEYQRHKNTNSQLMTDFKTYYNPLIGIGRLAFSFFFGGLTCFVIYLFIHDFNINSNKQHFLFILGALIFGAIFQMFFKEFISTTKNYKIGVSSIEEFNFLTLSTKTIYENEIKGFSSSIIPYRIWDFKQIIIYLKDGSKINLMQFAYFNFKEIKPCLLEKKYNYLGHEPYIWKWINSRVYRFDD
jgi:hypothetical protein